jgi:hypothetical protein
VGVLTRSDHSDVTGIAMDVGELRCILTSSDVTGRVMDVGELGVSRLALK